MRFSWWRKILLLQENRVTVVVLSWKLRYLLLYWRYDLPCCLKITHPLLIGHIFFLIIIIIIFILLLFLFYYYFLFIFFFFFPFFFFFQKWCPEHNFFMERREMFRVRCPTYIQDPSGHLRPIPAEFPKIFPDKKNVFFCGLEMVKIPIETDFIQKDKWAILTYFTM